MPDDLAGALNDSFSRLEQRLGDLASAFDEQAPAPSAPPERRREAPRSARLDAALAEITSRQRALDEAAPATVARRGDAAPERQQETAPKRPARPLAADEPVTRSPARPQSAAERDWRLPMAPPPRPDFAGVRDRFARGPEADHLAKLERQLQSLASYMASAPAREAPPRAAAAKPASRPVEQPPAPPAEDRAPPARRRPPERPVMEPSADEPGAPEAVLRRRPAVESGDGEPRLGRLTEELTRNGRMIQSANYTAAEHAAALDTKIAGLTRVVEEIGERIDRLAETAAPDRKTLESLRASILEIRNRAGGMTGGDSAALAAIRTALDAITTRLDRLPAVEPERYAHTVRHEMTTVGERLIEAVRAELQKPTAISARDDAVREAIERLARRLERAEERGHFDPSAAVEAAMARLAEGLEPTAAPAALERLERGILDILRQIEDGRALASESVEAVAARAVRTTLAALQGAEIGRGDGGELARELADLRGLSEANQRRIIDALAGVRDALERVTGRFAGHNARPNEAEAIAPAPIAAEETTSTTERARAAALEAASDAESEGTLVPVIAATAATDNAFPAPAPEPAQERAQLIAAARRALMESELERSRAERGEERPLHEPLQGANDNASGGRRLRRLAIGLAAALVLVGSWQIGRVLTNRSDATTVAEATPPAGPQVAAADVHPEAAGPAKDDARPPAADIAPAPATASEAASAPSATEVPAATAAKGPIVASVTTAPVSAAPETPAEAAAAPAQTASVAAADPATTASLPPVSAAVPLPFAAPTETAALPAAIGGERLIGRAGDGDAAAQYEVGLRYFEGHGGLKSDPAKAAEWFARAAKQGLVPAEYRLGALYEKGIGVKKDPAKAREWYEKAADQGNVRAMHNLGVLFANGAAGKPDFATAARWFRKAADYGLKDSQYNLGVLYARGLAVKQNLPEAYLWFSLAADQGDKDAAAKRDELAKKMASQQLVTARLAAGTWQAKKRSIAANEVAAPPGGWDRPATARATPAKH